MAIRSLGPVLWEKNLLYLITKYFLNLEALEEVRWNNNFFLKKNNCLNTLSTLMQVHRQQTALNWYHRQRFTGKNVTYTASFFRETLTSSTAVSSSTWSRVSLSTLQTRTHIKRIVKRCQLQYLAQHNKLWLADSLGTCPSKDQDQIYDFQLKPP